MPSLPTNNTQPGSPTDSYRKYLPSGYQFSFELYEKNRAKILYSFFQWLLFCVLCCTLLLCGNFSFQFLHWQLIDDKSYGNYGVRYSFVYTLLFYIHYNIYTIYDINT